MADGHVVVPGRWLIVSLQGLGDTVMVTPLLQELERYPAVSLTLILSDNGSAQYIRSLGLTNVAAVYVWRERENPARNILRLGRILRRESFDVACATYPAGRRESTLLLLARARDRRILRYYRGFFKSWQFLHATAPIAERSLHNVEANAWLFGLSKPVKRVCLPRPGAGQRVIFGFHIGSKGVSKRWDVANFAEVMNTLQERFDSDHVVFAGHDEAPLVEALRQRVHHKFEALVGADFGQLREILLQTTLFVGNDSALAHMAATLGVPTVVLWAFGEFWRVSPYGEGNIVVKKDYSCIPCYDFTKPYVVDCPFHLRCIRHISSSEVSEVVSVCVRCLIEGRLPSVEDVTQLDFVVAAERLKTGCLLVTLRGGAGSGGMNRPESK